MKVIPLTKGYFTIVSDESYDALRAHKWCSSVNPISNRVDAVRRCHETGKIISMPRQIMGLKRKDGLVVDHINHDSLDNRISNLRVCTQSQNCLNTSSRKNSTSMFLGVTRAIRGNYVFWRATIRVNKKLMSLGYFKYTDEGERQAAEAYNKAALIHYKEFANLNKL